MNINERIKARREELGLTLEDVAKALGVNRSTILRYESEDIKKVPVDAIKPLAAVLRCSPEYLMGWEKDINMYQDIGVDFMRIPLYRDICCGNGGFVDDNIVDYVPVTSQGLNMKNEHFCMFAQGDSMESMIEEGDLLVFEKTSSPRENMIGAFCLGENEATCRKYVVQGNTIMLKPLNAKYDPVLVNIEDIKCVGELKKIIRDVK